MNCILNYFNMPYAFKANKSSKYTHQVFTIVIIMLIASLANIAFINNIFANEPDGVMTIVCKFYGLAIKLVSFIALAAIIAIGFSAATGRIEMKQAVTVIFGLVIMVSASQIILWLTDQNISEMCNKFNQTSSDSKK